MDHRSTTYLDGRWVPTSGRHLITVIDPSTEQCVATVPECDEDDVSRAVEAAGRALEPLGRLPVAERAAMLERIADRLDARASRLAELISLEMGMPRRLCRAYQVDSAVGVFRQTARALGEVRLCERIGHSVVTREPVGVVAAITPWNYPLLQAASKVAPALAAGSPVVLKPSELAPLDAFLLAEAVDEAGLPPGAFNVVLGTGPDVGESLVRHPGIGMVSLTGSTRAGRRVSQLAGAGVKRVALELGGKSAAVVLPDADLEAAVEHCVRTVMVNTGQTCTALTRLLAPYDQLADVEALVGKEMSGYRVGPASDPQADVGPLASAVQQQRVGEHVERARFDGARAVWELPRDALPERGCFFPPVAFVAPDPGVALAQEEVFGPVLAVVPYVDEDDAVAIANGTAYGLAAAVWSRDPERALRIASRLEAGTVDVNGAQFNGLAPFGGWKSSGHGRELGRYGIEEFTELRSIQLPPEVLA